MLIKKTPSFSFALKHNESVKVLGLENGTGVTVTERSNPYKASCSVNGGTKTTNPSPNMDLVSTATIGTEDVHIRYENTKIIPVPTGVQSAKKVITILLIFEALILMFVKKKKK